VRVLQGEEEKRIQSFKSDNEKKESKVFMSLQTEYKTSAFESAKIYFSLNSIADLLRIKDQNQPLRLLNNEVLDLSMLPMHVRWTVGLFSIPFAVREIMK
jgi:hypothetical protein